MRSPLVTVVSVTAVLVWWTALSAAAHEPPAVVERFVSRVEEPLQSYTGRRIMRARNDRLSKSPSFWTSRVDIVRTYRRINGVRVPVELQSTAHVRIAGPSLMQVQHLYSSINDLPAGDR